MWWLWGPLANSSRTWFIKKLVLQRQEIIFCFIKVGSNKKKTTSSFFRLLTYVKCAWVSVKYKIKNRKASGLKTKTTVGKVCHHPVSRIEFPSVPQRTKAYNQYQYVFASADDRSQHFAVKVCPKIRSKKIVCWPRSKCTYFTD